MKLAFIFDVRFTKYNNHYYSTNLTQEFWTKRYLRVFDEIIVIGRYMDTNTDPTGKLVISDNDKVHFHCIKEIKPILRIFNQEYESKFISNEISDCDAVICRGWWGVKECKKNNKKYLVESVSCVWDAYWNHGTLGKLVAPYMYIKQRAAIKNAPYVIYVTNQFLQRRYPTTGRSTNVSNVMLYNEIYGQEIEQRCERIKTINNRDYVVIGTAAAVDVKYKGQEFVIKALARLKKKGIERYVYRMIGAGNPEYLLHIAKKLKVEEFVEIQGAIPHSQVANWLDSIDIYIQPSLQEGLPRSLIEAMSRGVPCLGTKTGGIPELLEPAFVCKNNRVIDKQLASMIEKLNDISIMEKCVFRNIKEAEKYKADVLEARRYNFLKMFSEE